jgi:signal peptidase I
MTTAPPLDTHTVDATQGEHASARGGGWPRRTLAILLLGVLGLVVVRGFLFQSYMVPSTSMLPTIAPGDRILVNRTVEDDDLRRGDVIVFDGTRGFASATLSPHQAEGLVPRLTAGFVSLVGINLGERNYVKRVVGLPGDHVRCCDASGRITVNGTPLDEVYLADGERPSDMPFDVVVPAERVWVMGDYRSLSGDSRAHLHGATSGMVHVDNIVGRAELTFWPLSRVGRLSPPPDLTSTTHADSGR